MALTFYWDRRSGVNGVLRVAEFSWILSVSGFAVCWPDTRAAQDWKQGGARGHESFCLQQHGPERHGD